MTDIHHLVKPVHVFQSAGTGAVSIGLAGYGTDNVGTDGGVALNLRDGVVFLHGQHRIDRLIGKGDIHGLPRSGRHVIGVVVVDGDRGADQHHLVGVAASVKFHVVCVLRRLFHAPGPFQHRGGLRLYRTDFDAEDGDILLIGNIRAGPGRALNVGAGAAALTGAEGGAAEGLAVLVLQILKVGRRLQNGHNLRIHTGIFLFLKLGDVAVVGVGVRGGQNHLRYVCHRGLPAAAAQAVAIHNRSASVIIPAADLHIINVAG